MKSCRSCCSKTAFKDSKGLHDKHGLCTFKHKFVHTPCTFKQKFVHTLCTFKHFLKHILIFIYTASFHLNLTHPYFEKKNKFSVFIRGRKKFTYFSFQEPKQQQNYIFFFPTRTNCNHNDLSTNAKWSLR